jgi:hypothetical protein
MKIILIGFSLAGKKREIQETKNRKRTGNIGMKSRELER